MIQRVLFTFLFCASLMGKGIGQFSYSMRLHLVDVDTSTQRACYDLQLSNPGDVEWYLGSANIFVFYDYSAACLLPEESFLLLDEAVYGLNNIALNAQKNENTGLPLSYSATLGSLRLGLNANNFGLLMDTSATWHSVVRLCFELQFDDIFSVNTCFEANFIDEQIQMFLPVVDIVENYDRNPALVTNVLRAEAQNLMANGTRNSCFVQEENTPTLCSDGIDNDEDGLVDCDDTTGCSVRTPSFNVNNPGACDDRPSIIRVNGVTGDDVMYSIDDGLTFQTDSVFSGFPAGDYEVLIIRNGVLSCGQIYPIRLIEEECRENDNNLCQDGLDNDSDGLIDCADPDCQPIFSEVIIENPDNCPFLNNGQISLDFDPGRFSLSVDSGMNFIALVELTQLSEGDYNLALQNKITGCITFYKDNPVTLNAPVCPNESGGCNDGIDNDLDGLIDCDDSDCTLSSECTEEAPFYIPNVIQPYSAINALFGVYAPGDKPLMIEEMKVFDRWGGILHQREQVSSDDMTHFWDGRYNKLFVQPGVYMYLIVINQNGLSTSRQGTVTVLN